MNKLFLLLIAIIVVSSSCNKEWDPYAEKEYEQINLDQIPTQELTKYEPLDINTDSIAVPGRLLIMGDYLFAGDTRGDHLLHAMDLKEKKYLKSCLVKGSGPGELLNVWELNRNDKGQITLVDFIQRKYASFNLDNLLNEEKPVPLSETLMDEKFLVNLESYKDRMYFMEPETGTNRVYESDQDFKNMKGYGTLLTKKTTTTTNGVHASVCNARAARLGSKIFIAYKLAPFIEIFDIDSNDWNALMLPKKYNPIYGEFMREGTPGFVNLEEETRDAYADLYATDQYIYILYDGRIWKEGNYMEGNKTVFVFDKNGKIVKQLKLAKGVIEIAVHNDKTLYGVNFSGINPEIIKYEFSL